MGLTKIQQSGWRYYTTELVAADDYWAEETPGRWIGKGAGALGLSGPAGAGQLENLFGYGRHPDTGAPLGRPYPRQETRRVVAGYALAFSPPKSVSALWALGDDDTAAAVTEAQAAAVRAGMDYLDRHSAFCRRGHAGALQADTEGLMAVAFDHRTSRAGDPQLHTHVLVANKVLAASDGAWLSLDGRELYEFQKATGMVYKAALRAELTRSLNLSWTEPDANGCSEVRGVPSELCARWSSRAAAVRIRAAELVAEREAALGRALSANERAQASQLAAYETRGPKTDAHAPTASLRARWRAEAEGLGLGMDAWRDSLPLSRVRAGWSDSIDIQRSALSRLADGAASFGRAEVTEAVAATVDAGVVGARAIAERIEALTDEVLAHPDVLGLCPPRLSEPPAFARRTDGMSGAERHGGARYTTRTILAAEAAVLVAAAALDERVSAVPETAVERVLATRSLGADQAEALRRVVTGAEAVSVVVGPAGVGKSRMLEALGATYRDMGVSVSGLAPSAMAAAVLAKEAGIPVETLARFCLDIDINGARVRPESVVVIDEAGMARTDELVPVVASARAAGAKVVLVGDPAQLGAVGPGGLFRLLAADAGIELDTPRRFSEGWEAAATLALRARDPAVLATYARHGRISGGAREAVLDAAHRAWAEARTERRSVVVCAGDHDTVGELALRARAARVAAGEVEPEGILVGPGRIGVGDEVVTLRNDRRLVSSTGAWVRNGARWVVEAREGYVLVLRSAADGGRVVLPSDYAREHVALSYALTVHKAQGTTVDASVVVVDPGMTAAQLYVGMTRGRHDNRAMVVTEDNWAGARVRAPSAEEVLAGVLRHEGAELSAHEVMRHAYLEEPSRAALLSMLGDARRYIDAHAGLDRSGEIAARSRRPTVAPAQQSLEASERALAAARERGLAAQSDAAAAAGERSLRAHLPGALGEGARWRLDIGQRAADIADSVRAEREALREYEAARRGHEVAVDNAPRLDELQHAQNMRDRWLMRHPAERRWVADLEERIQNRHIAAQRLGGTRQRSSGRSLARENDPIGPGHGQPAVCRDPVDSMMAEDKRTRDRTIDQHFGIPQAGRDRGRGHELELGMGL